MLQGMVAMDELRKIKLSRIQAMNEIRLSKIAQKEQMLSFSSVDMTQAKLRRQISDLKRELEIANQEIEKLMKG